MSEPTLLLGGVEFFTILDSVAPQHDDVEVQYSNNGTVLVQRPATPDWTLDRSFGTAQIDLQVYPSKDADQAAIENLLAQRGALPFSFYGTDRQMAVEIQKAEQTGFYENDTVVYDLTLRVRRDCSFADYFRTTTGDQNVAWTLGTWAYHRNQDTVYQPGSTGFVAPTDLTGLVMDAGGVLLETQPTWTRSVPVLVVEWTPNEEAVVYTGLTTATDPAKLTGIAPDYFGSMYAAMTSYQTTAVGAGTHDNAGGMETTSIDITGRTIRGMVSPRAGRSRMEAWVGNQQIMWYSNKTYTPVSGVTAPLSAFFVVLAGSATLHRWYVMEG